ncbi:MAG: hypothetical protein AVDCRST_MAG56-840, partial [uncultured Cytophagales bacterium]
DHRFSGPDRGDPAGVAAPLPEKRRQTRQKDGVARPGAGRGGPGDRRLPVAALPETGAARPRRVCRRGGRVPGRRLGPRRNPVRPLVGAARQAPLGAGLAGQRDRLHLRPLVGDGPAEHRPAGLPDGQVGSGRFHVGARAGVSAALRAGQGLRRPHPGAPAGIREKVVLRNVPLRPGGVAPGKHGVGGFRGGRLAAARGQMVPHQGPLQHRDPPRPGTALHLPGGPAAVPRQKPQRARAGTGLRRRHPAVLVAVHLPGGVVEPPHLVPFAPLPRPHRNHCQQPPPQRGLHRRRPHARRV